jgi:nucleotide-binding universal stress UspA family protein
MYKPSREVVQMQEAAKRKARVSIQNVLFATDLSHASAPAIAYALEIARLYGAKICAVHVRTGEWDKFQEQESDRLRELLKGIPHEFLVVPGGPTALKESGDTPTTLLSLVGTKNIDLIVVGTHGRSGLGRVLVGSVAETIFREAPCPVLTVGPRLMSEPKWNLKIKEVLYATDLTPSSEGALPYAISLSQENKARLTILSVLPKPKAGELVEAERLASSTLQRMQELVLPETELWCQPNCIVETGDPAEKILDMAGGYKADIIVLGIHPHSVGAATHLLRPTAHRVVAGATCPVLTVRG